MADTSQVRTRIARRSNGAIEKGSVGNLLDRLKPQIARALPGSAAVTAERFTRIALTEFRRNPKLLDCTEQSLLGGLLLSAQLGLEIGGPLGQSWLIPFRDIKTGTSEAIWILGYKGIIALAYRSGELASIEARDVCEGDDFSYRYGLD